MASRRRLRSLGPFIWVILIVLTAFIPESYTQSLDEWIYRQFYRAQHLDTDGSVQLRRSPDEPIETRPTVTERRYITCPTVGAVSLDEASVNACFAATPLGPQDFAVIINKLAGAGAGALAFSSPLVWEENAGPMAQDMLCSVMKRFQAACFGLRGRMAAQADFTPVVLRDYSIPQANITGDPTGLPAANRPLPNSLSETPDAISADWAPDWLEDEPLTQVPSVVKDISFPLLMRWNGETMPTLPLRVALRRKGIDPKDVTVHIGKEIRIGDRVLPLDAHGRIRIEHAAVSPLPLEDVVGEGAALKALGAGVAVVMEQPAANQPTYRLEQLALTLSELLGEIRVEQIHGTEPVHAGVLDYTPVLPSTWGEWALTAIALYLGIIVMRHAPVWLVNVILLGLLVVLGFQAWQYVEEGKWFPLASLCVGWLLIWIAATRKPRKKRDLIFS